MGRPSDYTPETADIICQRLVDGHSLRSICLDESMPGRRTVFEWLEAHEDFRTKYARARDIQAEFGFDELQEIATDGTDVLRDRLRIDTLKWRLSKLLPKKYGDKIENTLKGDKDAPLLVSTVDAAL